jgi:hypothetical protein
MKNANPLVPVCTTKNNSTYSVPEYSTCRLRMEYQVPLLDSYDSKYSLYYYYLYSYCTCTGTLTLTVEDILKPASLPGSK